MSFICLVGSIAILFFILKYRVHVHVTLTNSRDARSVMKGRRAEKRLVGADVSTATTRPVPIAIVPESVVWGDIASGLVNLGASKAQARIAARKACREYPDADFNSVFTAALQEVGRAA